MVCRRYWAKSLPEGYLKTVGTVALLRAFAKLSVPEGCRLCVTVGTDNMPYMPTWTKAEDIFRCTDMVQCGVHLWSI